MQERWPLIDALRGVAASAVVIFHIYLSSYISIDALPIWLAATMRNGIVGVPIFFVLSGFVIAHSLRNHDITLPLVGRFALRRAIRLDPAYWAAIALSILVSQLPAILSAGKSAPEISFSQVAAHLFYLQDILRVPTINVVFWTLCLEVQFYLIYIGIIAFGRSVPILIAAAISLLWATNTVSVAWPGSFLPLWYSWLLGALAYSAWRERNLRLPFAAFVTIIAYSAVLQSDRFAIASVLTTAILYGASRFGQMRRGDWQWLQFLGAISYSLYLTHIPILNATYRVGYAVTGRNMALEAAWFLITIAACVSFAAAMWLLIERPSARFARNIPLSKPAHSETSA